MALALRRPPEDLGLPLADATFCVVDLETTGGSPADGRITEIGAVKVRRGEVLGEFQSLVDPGVPIPRFIEMLTGISDDMVAASPPIEALLPAFLEFAGDAVLVAHNASFDHRFLQANLARLGYEPLRQPVVCTVRLARRLVRDDVPNLQLATLAAALHSRFAPAHRALPDARACCDVFHALLERAGRWGVTHLDDLLWFQSCHGHPEYRKVRLAEGLPRSRGVYLFRDARARVLYAGKAANLRARVRSYFSGGDRRKIEGLLREVERIDAIECATDLEASVLEARLIRRHAPRYNSAGRGRGVYLALSRERFPRLAVTRTSRADALGPVPAGTAAAVREALEEAAGIRTCSARIGTRTRFPACVLGQIGRCPAPCEGRVTPDDYAVRLFPVRSALGGDAGDATEAVSGRMDRLAAQARFEEAAATRDRLGALVATIARARDVDALVRAGRVRVEVDGRPITLAEGRVACGLPAEPDGHPDEPRLVAAWLDRNRAKVRLVEASGSWAVPVSGGRALHEWAARIKRSRVTG